MTSLTAVERAMIGEIDAGEMLSRTLSWATINSGTSNLAGLDRMAEVLRHAFGALPGAVTLHDPDPVERIDAKGEAEAVQYGRHLSVCVRPDAERRVLLTGHMDTVFAADHPFQTCEWIDDNRLRGPGTADMKGGIALMLAGVQAFERSAPDLGYDILITSDEETGSLSSARLIEQMARGKFAALTYEPSLPDGRMARARPGSGNFSAVVTGRAAHAGRNPEEGRNALVAAADLALRLAVLVRPGLTVNPAAIDGGAPNNMVPSLAILRFNMRPGTREDMADASAQLAELTDAVAARHDVAIRVHGGFGRPPKSIGDAEERLFRLVRDAATGLDEALSWADTGGVCDGNNISACGVPVIDTMGAVGGAIHSPNEYLLVDSLARRAALTALVLHRLNLGDTPR